MLMGLMPALRPHLAQARDLIVRRRLAAALLGLSACGAPAPAPENAPPRSTPTDQAEEPTASEPVEPLREAPRSELRPELRPAGEGPVADLVAGELRAAQADRRELVVYVGAPWCEPCVAFHDALLAGELDAELPATRFLEFNMDRDQERLTLAGYTSRLVPLFVRPQADGRAGAQRMEGGIKGPGAAANLSGRLRRLLAD